MARKPLYRLIKNKFVSRGKYFVQLIHDDRLYFVYFFNNNKSKKKIFEKKQINQDENKYTCIYVMDSPYILYSIYIYIYIEYIHLASVS